MKEPLDFLEGINEVDPALLAEASGDRRRSGAGRLRWIALAAALLLILGGMTAFAAASPSPGSEAWTRAASGQKRSCRG